MGYQLLLAPPYCQMERVPGRGSWPTSRMASGVRGLLQWVLAFNSWVQLGPFSSIAAGNIRQNANNTPLAHEFVTAMVKGGSDGFALKGGDATHGALSVLYDGPRPAGYQPMKKQGSISATWWREARRCSSTVQLERVHLYYHVLTH